MMKKIFPFCFLLLALPSFSQGNQPWKSFFSYYDIVDISQSSTTVYGAASSAVFSSNIGTNELKTITSVDGLKAETITAIHYSPEYKKTLVGNSNGLLLIVNDDNSVSQRVDIVQESTVAAAKKKINHIYEYEGKAYISCDFGIAVFNLGLMEFGDTYYLGPNGAEIAVSQSTIANGYIYAALPTHGLYRGSLSNPNLNDYSQWMPYIDGQWNCVAAYNNNVFISDASGGVFRIQNDVPAAFSILPSVVTDLRAANGYMVATSKERVNVFQDLAQVFQVNFINYDEPGNITFNCATVINSRLYVGTNEKGVFTSPLTTASFENITPDGPERSNIFRIKKSPNFLWVVYGDYSPAYNPDPAEFYGVGKYGANGWLRIFFDYLFYLPNISDIAVHPNNENVAYVSSYYRGLIKIEDNTGVVRYDENIEDEDGPESDTPGQSRVFINSLAFDNEGDLWMTNAFVENAIKVLRPDSDDWDAYSVEDIVATTPDNEPYGRMAIDKNNTKWIPSRFTGVIGFNEDIDKFIVITTGDNGNLPAADARCVAVDKNGRLWIGTTMGLRVLSNIDRFMTEDELTTNPIIIMEDGLAQELMFEQGIVDIEVDGSNNKWIGTATAGAFLVSPDGQETLFHFTKENSPLPSNTINDIEIDDQTGEVFFATNKGMVSYAGTSTEAENDLSNVYVFPNPVRPEFQGDVNISGLMDNVNLKITDIEGNLVYETTSEGGTVLWDTRAFGKYKVASGVYMIFIASEDGSKTKVKKVMIIR